MTAGWVPALTQQGTCESWTPYAAALVPLTGTKSFLHLLKHVLAILEHYTLLRPFDSIPREPSRQNHTTHHTQAYSPWEKLGL